MDKREKLKQFPLFKDLSPREIEIISQVVKEEILPAHTNIIEQDGQSNLAYFIQEGGTKVYRISEDGEEVNLAVLGEGEVVGEMALIDDEPRSANVDTIQETKVFILSRTDFNRILISNPEVAISLLKTFAKRVRNTNEHVEDILSRNLGERTWKVLLSLANYFPNKDINLSQEELAGIIGATRARVTEVLNDLQTQGKIILSHRNIHLN